MLTNFMTCSDIKQKNILNKVNIKAKFVSNLQFIQQMQNTYMYDNIVTLRITTNLTSQWKFTQCYSLYFNTLYCKINKRVNF